MKEVQTFSDCYLVDKAEAASFFGVSARTIDSWIQRRVLPFYKFGNGRNGTIRFKRSDLENFVNKSRVGDGPE